MLRPGWYIAPYVGKKAHHWKQLNGGSFMQSKCGLVASVEGAKSPGQTEKCGNCLK